LQLAPTDINYVYLVGGATRMPIIQNLVKHLFSNANIIQEYPEQAVVYGATIHAATLNNTQNISQIIFPPENPNIYLTIENNLDLSNNSHINQKHQVSFLGGHTLSNPSSYSSNYLLTKDIATHRLGIIVLNSQGQKFVDTVIPRYTPLPYTTHEYYYTAYDNQISIELEIVEGESPYPEDCVYLGYAHITDIPPRPAGQRINIAFTYDINNILQINLLDIGSGQRQNILLQRPQSNYHHIKQTILTRQIK
jgi:molecular chaperone DnaK (HSP70)